MTPVVLGPNDRERMPSPDAVRDLYAAAAAEPPLAEPAAAAEVYARVYGGALRHEQPTAVVAEEDGQLVAFAYGHPWRWAEQRYPWADDLRTALGSTAEDLDDTFVLCLLARDPGARGTGVGRRALAAWLDAVGPARVWLVTTDLPTPARRRYTELGFARLSAGPDTPDGRSAVVLARG